MIPGSFSNGRYDTEPYHTWISIYCFDVFDKPNQAVNSVLVKGVKMDTVKRKAHQRATTLGLKSDGRWQNSDNGNYASREYRTDTQARRLVVLERS